MDILASAREHFQQRGYESTSIENIAETAGVSAVTIYNHYRTKGGVLLALVTESDSVLIGKIQKVMQAPPEEPLTAVCAFFGTVNEHAFSYLDRELWRHVIAISVIEGDSQFGQVYRSLDAELIRLLAALLEDLDHRFDRLQSDDHLTAAEVLYNVHNARFMEYIIDPACSESRRDSLTRRDIAFVMAQLERIDS
ncbi:TetR/AcrR family transcriptional regulator [Marinobacterium aestuariivivens]|uniref:TetR/AcrR family transcriptional regulator n=2 Tax=Marinobacterium aestuariivivens TaxID=1698799 RepID=A0ABW1ZVP7_9GAMM